MSKCNVVDMPAESLNGLKARRIFLARSAGVLATGMALAGGAIAATPKEVDRKDSSGSIGSLDQAKWALRNRHHIEALLARNGLTSPSYSAEKRPYAVFDWDNTSIMNDTEEALFMYQ